MAFEFSVSWGERLGRYRQTVRPSRFPPLIIRYPTAGPEIMFSKEGTSLQYSVHGENVPPLL